MPLRDLAMLDDATFDATGVRVTDGCVVLHGSVVERGTSVGTARLPVTLTVPDAVDVTVDLAGGTGDLVLDRVEVEPTTVTLVGVVPARVVVTTSAQSQALLDVGTTPIAVRRWGRWRPWGTGGPVVLDHRYVVKRLRTTACPECGHRWSEHSTDPDESLTMCTGCAREHGYGQPSTGATVCFARVPNGLVEPRSAALRTPPSGEPLVGRREPAASNTGGLFRLTISSLREASAALAFGMVSSDEVSALAAELLAAGHDGDSLVALASLYSGAATSDALDLGRAALVEAGVRPMDLRGDEVPLLALRVACHRFLLGHWTLRTFASWVHREIGHEGPEAAQQLALVDDELDELDERGAGPGPSFRRAVERLAVDYVELTDVATGYGYQAGPASLTNQNLLRDIRTVVTWPVASERDRTLLALGTYDVDARVVSKGDDGTAVVEYTATNETTLGSALRIPGLDYDALNRAAGDHGPFSRVTERFTWKEKVKW